MKEKFLPLFFIFALSLVPKVSMAQSQAGLRWIFGNTTRTIQFNRFDSSASVVNVPAKAAMGLGGSVVVTDPASGILQFYSNGQTIYDATNAPMANGTGLSGQPNSNQPVAVALVPGQTNQYFVITNSANFTTGGTIQYSVVDMAQTGNPSPSGTPLGAVTQKNVAVPGLANLSEGMILVPHANGTDFWLITHTQGNTQYNVTLFTPTGPVSTQTFTGLGLIERVGNFTWNSATNQLAVSPQEANRNVEILDFDPASGSLSLSSTLLNSAVPALTTNAIYDVEWSAGGDYIYVSQTGENGATANLLQYDVNNPNATAQSVLPGPIERSFGLTTGLDGAIYHIYQVGGQIRIGKITDPDEPAASVNYDPAPFGTTTFDGRQFSSFAVNQQQTITADFTFQGTCANAPTKFFPTVTPPADSVRWSIGPAPFSTAYSPIHTFDQGGTFQVTLKVFLNGDSTEVTKPVTIRDFNVQVNLVQDTTACPFELPEPINPNGPKCTDPAQCFTLTAEVQGAVAPTYTWYGPEGQLPGTGLELRPRSAGYYYLVVSDQGCETYAGVNIREYLQPDPRANVWYFGDAGVDFNPLFKTPSTPAVPITDSQMDAPEGTATISDRNGNVILYTDGRQVWNKANTLVATDIGGDPSSTQSAIVMPVPGDETLYYIFTTQATDNAAGTYQMNYSVFDLKLNNGSGGIVDPDENPATPQLFTTLFEKSTERLTGVGEWIIAHEYGNNTFRAYRVTSEGVSSPVISTIGSDHPLTSTDVAEGAMAINNGRLAVTLGNTIELFDFDEATGGITNFRTVSAPSDIYAVGFSPGGEKMFATLKGSNTIVEYAWDPVAETYNQIGQINTPDRPGGMQVGPDGTLYVAILGSDALSSIDVNTDPATVSTLQPDAIPLNGGTVGLGLPNFTQIVAQPIQDPFATVSEACVDSPTQFAAGGKDDNIDQFLWTFSDGVTSTERELERTFTTPGPYWAELTITNKCEGTYYSPPRFNFQVFPRPPVPPLLNGAPPVVCEPGTTLFAAIPLNPDFDYLWNTGATTDQIVATTPGLYSVTVTNRVTQCTNQGNVTLLPLFTDFDLGPDLDLCQNQAYQINVGIVGIDAYEWRRNGVVIPNNPSDPGLQIIDTSVPGVYTYQVTLTEVGCQQVDQVTLTVRASPTFTAAGVNATCLVNNGAINVQNIAGNPGPFTYYAQSISNPAPAPITGVAPGSYQITPLAAGSYTVFVVDEVSQCAASQVATVNNTAFTVGLVENGQACHPSIGITATVTPVAPGVLNPPLSYQVLDPGGALILSGTSASASFTTGGVPRDGQYTVTVRDAAGCVASSQINVTQNAAHTIAINPPTCPNGTLQVEAVSPTGATTFVWTSNPAGIAGAGSTATLPTVSANTSYEVSVTGSGGAFCPATATRTVVATPAVNADFSQSDACLNPVTLTATPNQTGLRYDWLRGGVLVSIGQTRTIGLSEDQSFYQVRVTNNVNGCQDDSPVRAVRVLGPFSVTMTVPAVLCENTDFVLTATPSRPAAVFQWSRDNDIIPGQNTATLTDRRAGTYTVRAFDVCFSSPDEEVIVPDPLPTIEVGGLRRICPAPGPVTGRSTTLIPTVAGNAPLTQELFLVNGNTETSVGTGTEFIIDQPGLYRARVTSADGCPAADELEVIVECDPIIAGPNAFRPGSTLETNSAFNLITQFITDEDFQIFIFNRWGEMVFESSDRTFRWNGGYNNNAGQILPAGTYAYVVRYRSEFFPDQGVKEKRGGVVLVR